MNHLLVRKSATGTSWIYSSRSPMMNKFRWFRSLRMLVRPVGLWKSNVQDTQHGDIPSKARLALAVLSSPPLENDDFLIAGNLFHHDIHVCSLHGRHTDQSERAAADQQHVLERVYGTDRVGRCRLEAIDNEDVVRCDLVLGSCQRNDSHRATGWSCKWRGRTL